MWRWLKSLFGGEDAEVSSPEAAPVSDASEAEPSFFEAFNALLEDGDLLAALADLAPVCDPATKVIVVGATNDIALYRELVAEGVAEYLLAPVDALALIGAVLRLFPNEGAAHIGKIHAVIGTKGGVGSSVLGSGSPSGLVIVPNGRSVRRRTLSRMLLRAI